MTNLIKNWKTWAVLIIVVLAIVFGAWGMQKWKVYPLQVENVELQQKVKALEIQKENLEKALGILQKEKNEIRAQTVTVTETELVYVTKEIDPATGQREKTDVNLTIDPQVVHVMVNGKPFEVPILAGEEYIFQDGKLVLKQASVMTLDLKLPEAPKKSLRVGAYTEFGTERKHPDIGLRINKEWSRADADVYLNQDKDIKLQGTWWF